MITFYGGSLLLNILKKYQLIQNNVSCFLYGFDSIVAGLFTLKHIFYFCCCPLLTILDFLTSVSERTVARAAASVLLRWPRWPRCAPPSYGGAGCRRERAGVSVTGLRSLHFPPVVLLWKNMPNTDFAVLTTFECYRSAALSTFVSCSRPRQRVQKASRAAELRLCPCPFLPCPRQPCCPPWIQGFDSSKYVVQMESYGVCLLVTGLFHLARCPCSSSVSWHLLKFPFFKAECVPL